MSPLSYLSPEQIKRIEPCFPLSHGVPRVDDRRIVSGFIYVIKHGLQWKEAPRCFIWWSRLGVFNKIFAEDDSLHCHYHGIQADGLCLKTHGCSAESPFAPMARRTLPAVSGREHSGRGKDRLHQTEPRATVLSHCCQRMGCGHCRPQCRYKRARPFRSVDFGDLGVDALFVDEKSHEFKNLSYATSMDVFGCFTRKSVCIWMLYPVRRYQVLSK